ncbi:MAG: hypothetical protein IKO20_04020 [Bacteroidaceae bacterium]|nr:hypothetical protein [Bacteroidaceae bacterium]
MNELSIKQKAKRYDEALEKSKRLYEQGTIPDGKRAEWINGVLTLVDEENVDNRPVTERIKTFEDAMAALGESHPLVIQLYDNFLEEGGDGVKDIVAYLKLRIIVAALNEGWEPKFTKDERRYFPWFKLYTQEDYDELDDEEKARVVYRGSYGAYAYGGVSYAYAGHDASNSNANVGSRLALRTRELAAYAGRQFIEEWADFVFKPQNGELQKPL